MLLDVSLSCARMTVFCSRIAVCGLMVGDSCAIVRRGMMMKSGTRRRAAILTAVMLLSGCGTTPNRGTSGSGGMLTWQQANEEYKATVEDFPFELMNGDAFPANIPKAQAASSL